MGIQHTRDSIREAMSRKTTKEIKKIWAEGKSSLPKVTREAILELLQERGEVPEASGGEKEVKKADYITSNYELKKLPGQEAIEALKFFAWLELIASLVLGIWILVKFSQTAVPGFTYLKEINPISIAIGIATILQGMFLCVLFLVIASIADNLIAIRINTAH